MTLLGFKTILHKKCRSGKNSEGTFLAMSSKTKINFKKSELLVQNINNSECFGVKIVKIYPEMTSK